MIQWTTTLYVLFNTYMWQSWKGIKWWQSIAQWVMMKVFIQRVLCGARGYLCCSAFRMKINNLLKTVMKKTCMRLFYVVWYTLSIFTWQTCYFSFNSIVHDVVWFIFTTLHKIVWYVVILSYHAMTTYILNKQHGSSECIFVPLITPTCPDISKFWSKWSLAFHKYLHWSLTNDKEGHAFNLVPLAGT